MDSSREQSGMQNGAPAGNEPLYDSDAQRTFWMSVATLYQWRRFIIGITAGMAVAAVIITLLMPEWYKASTRAVLPAGGGGGGLMSAVMSDLPSAAQSLLGGVSGDYIRHLAILNSRTIHGMAVDSFDMIEVYEIDDSETPRRDAIDLLQENTEFLIDDEYNFMSIEVLDQNPERAAALANFFVRALNRFTNKLAAEGEGTFSQVIETRYAQTEARLDSLMANLQALQSEYGVMNLEMQAPLFFQNVASLRLNALQAEARYKQLRSQYGANNALVQSAREAMQTANAQYQSALAGQEALMPVGLEEMPEVARQFYELDVQRQIAATVLQYMRPLVEQARFDELREVQALQVVDPAIPPTKDAKPDRGVICIVATLSAFLLAVVFVLLYSWWKRNHGRYAHRMATAVESEDNRRESVRTVHS